MDNLSGFVFLLILLIEKSVYGLLVSSDDIYIKSDGTATNCTAEADPCNSVATGLNIEGKSRRNIIFLDNFTLNEELTLSSRTHNIKSKDEDITILISDTSSKAPIFTIESTATFEGLKLNVSNGLTMEKVIYVKSTHLTITKSFVFGLDTNSSVKGFIYTEKGTFTIYNTTFQHIRSIGEYSAISCFSTDISFTNCTFFQLSHMGDSNVMEDVTAHGNIGGGLYHETNEQGVSIQIGMGGANATYKECEAARGGGMYLSFKQNPDFCNVTNVTFINNVASCTEAAVDEKEVAIAYGMCIFVDKVNTYLVNNERFPNFVGREEDDIWSMGIKDHHVIKLITFSNQYKDNIYVGDDGNDNNHCNGTDAVCKTLKKVEEFINYARYINIVGTYTMTAQWEVDNSDLTLQGMNSSCVLIAHGGCYFSINALNIKSLNVEITKEFENANQGFFLKVNPQGNLIMSSDTFKVASPDVKITDTIIKMDDSSLTIDNCIFTGICTKGTAGSVISGIAVYIYMYGCSFSNCKCETGKGGCLNVDFTSSLLFGRVNYNTTFKNNQADQGGAIYIHPDGCDSYILTELTFGKEDEANVANSGKNLFVVSRTLNTTCNLAHFPTLASESAGGNYFEGVEEEGDDPRDLIEILTGKYKEGPLMVYFTDPDNCNITDSDGKNKTCSTDPAGVLTNIAYETRRVKYATVNVTVGDSWTPKVCYDWTGNGYMVYGTTHDSKIKLEDQITFTLETDAEFRNLTMTIGSSISQTIFTAKFGELILYFVTICPAANGVSVIDGSLFLMEEFSDSQFESVSIINITTKSTGNVIHSTVGNGKEMKMTGVDYKNCKTEGDCGGALYVDVEDGGFFYFIKSGSSVSTVTGCQSASKGGAIYMLLHKSPLSITFTDTVFGTEGDDLNIAPDGGANIYIKADELEDSLLTASFSISSDYGLMQRIVFEDIESEKKYSLTEVFPDYSSDMYVSGEIDASEVFCGTLLSPCVSLNRAFKKSSGSKKEIKIVGNVTHEETLELNHQNSITGLNSSCGIICLYGSKYILTQDTTISSLIITPYSIDNTLMTVSHCTQTLTSVTFASEEAMEYIHLNSPLITILEKGRGVYTTCIFKGILATGANGAAVNAALSISTSLYIKGCSFINCKVENGNGGGLYADVSDDASIIIQSDGLTPCTFKGCSAKKASENPSAFRFMSYEEEPSAQAVESGRGGAFYLRFGDDPNKILVENVVFGTGEEKNEGSEGFDFFIEADNLSNIFTLDNFPILAEFSSDYEGGVGMNTGNTEIVSASSFVEIEDGFNYIYIIIIAASVVVVAIIIVVIIICLKMKK